MKKLVYCADDWKNGSGWIVEGSVYNSVEVADDYVLSEKDIDTDAMYEFANNDGYMRGDDVFYHTDLVDESENVISSVGQWLSDYKDKLN